MGQRVVCLMQEPNPCSAIAKVTAGLAPALAERGIDLDVSAKVSACARADGVLNMHVQRTHQLLSEQRYLHFGGLVSMWHPNLSELPAHEQVSVIHASSQHPLVFMSDHSRLQVHSAAAKVFAPSWLRQAVTRWRTGPYGLPEAVALADPPASPLHWVVPHTYLSVTRKHARLHLELSARISELAAAAGLGRCRHTFYWRDIDKAMKLSDWDLSAYDLRPMVSPPEAMLDAMGEHGCFLATAREESFGIFYLELLQRGLVGVFRASDWVHRLLPPDYPFIAREGDLPAMCLWVMQNHAQARSQLLDLVLPQLRRMYSHDRFADLVASLLHAEVERAGVRRVNAGDA